MKPERVYALYSYHIPHTHFRALSDTHIHSHVTHPPHPLRTLSSTHSPNIIAEIDAQHICLTQDGIRYVRERRRGGCGMDCQVRACVCLTCGRGCTR